MLQRLGFKSYAYDWRTEHLDDMAMELQQAQSKGIAVKSVWMWLDAPIDSLGALSPDNERVFQIIEEIGLKTEIWVSFPETYYKDLTDSAAVEKGVKVIEYLSNRARKLGCKVGLYNHGAWFGEPGNQVKIIEALPDHELGIIFNFHHAHPQLDYYPEIVNTMLPYLWSVNINGMKKDGPKIISIGQGDQEQQMIQQLMDKGFSGPFGILGHIEEADVEIILKNNLEGFAALEFTGAN